MDKKYKVKVTATIIIFADGKRFEQDVPLEYETTVKAGDNPKYAVDAELQKAGVCFGECELAEA